MELPRTRIELDMAAEISEEGRVPRTLRDLGTPSQDEVDRHNTNRSWSPACVSGRPRYRNHRKKEGHGEERIP